MVIKDRKYFREYYEKNKDKYKNSSKKWRFKNKEKVNQYKKERYNIIKKIGYYPLKKETLHKKYPLFFEEMLYKNNKKYSDDSDNLDKYIFPYLKNPSGEDIIKYKKRLENSRLWHEKNKNLHNKIKRDYYKNNKKIWNEYYQKNKEHINSRSRTNRLSKLNYLKIENRCRYCKETNNLQFHHEVYPLKDEDIIKAVSEGKIYKICQRHHSYIHSYFSTKL